MVSARGKRGLAAGLLAVSCLVGTTTVWAEDAAPPRQPGNEGRDGGGGGGGRGRGGPMMGGMRGGGMDWMARGLGQDVPAKVEDLPLGSDARFVTRIPVGGVENFQTFSPGAKVEQIFELTEEQRKALEDLRKEFAAEEAKITAQMDELNKKLASQAKELRQKYELKANDVLGGDLKAAKEKLDAIVKEYQDKRIEDQKGMSDRFAAFRAEMEKARDAGQEAIRAVFEKNKDLFGLYQQQQEKNNASADAAKEKMKTAVPEDAKAKLDEAFKRHDDGRGRGGDRGGRQGGDRGGRGGGQGGGGVQPAPGVDF